MPQYSKVKSSMLIFLIPTKMWKWGALKLYTKLEEEEVGVVGENKHKSISFAHVAQAYQIILHNALV